MIPHESPTVFRVTIKKCSTPMFSMLEEILNDFVNLIIKIAVSIEPLEYSFSIWTSIEFDQKINYLFFIQFHETDIWKFDFVRTKPIIWNYNRSGRKVNAATKDFCSDTFCLRIDSLLLCRSLMNCCISLCRWDYIFLPYNGSAPFRFKGFSPTHLSPTPIDEFHVTIWIVVEPSYF